MNKSSKVRMGNWEKTPLDESQRRYAATDAYASLLCFQALAALPNRSIWSSQQCLHGSEAPFIYPESPTSNGRMPTSDTESRSDLEEMISTVPQFRYVQDVPQDVQLVYNMFMGLQPLDLSCREISEIPQLAGTTLDVVYCNLATAILSGRRYDWKRLRIPRKSMHILAACLLQCLSDKLILEENVHIPILGGHPLARRKRNTADLKLLPFKSLVWHLASIVDGWRLFQDQTAVVDFEIVLGNAQVETQRVIRLLPHPLSYGTIRVVMAHIGRCATACLDDRRGYFV